MRQPCRQAVILVGGRGTRLGHLSASTPKPLIPVDGTPFLDRVLRQLVRHGFSDIILLAGHLGDQVAKRYDAISFPGATVRTVIELAPRGTAGALAEIAGDLDAEFLLMNGDSIFDCDLLNLIHPPLKPSQIMRMALRTVADVSRYGAVRIDGETVTTFGEKNHQGPGTINAGLYLCSRDILTGIKPGNTCSLELEIIPKLVKQEAVSGRVFTGYFLDIGLPETLALARDQLDTALRRPAVFFDRDGVLNEDTGYVGTQEAFVWRSGAREAISEAYRRGYLPIVITNQAGVARGYYTEDDVRQLHAWMNDTLRQTGVCIAAFYYCPYHIDGVVERYVRHCPSRKPNPGMLTQALADWSIDPAGSVLLGDKDSDIEAARRAGIRGVLVTETDLRADLQRALSGRADPENQRAKPVA
ncbi:HAD-IIIA family hydrolase [Eilatimonas milleporae]|uniref:D,D-heptose 1,7-bisphosphate phosphatase n=1 Tax=Eilatimonas milleporae TaxID=911205 RepID=A0A3M0C0D1_9PROT|nr:HAD-IIIA family hydrolase [Eilatimonas milleporae]RMB00659.1 D-glycero-D-manno-heptose 1,7-bisphosphate phosphatase [Eilatimonas milleporae]